jgi:hypothetical protein
MLAFLNDELGLHGYEMKEDPKAAGKVVRPSLGGTVIQVLR